MDLKHLLLASFLLLMVAFQSASAAKKTRRPRASSVFLPKRNENPTTSKETTTTSKERSTTSKGGSTISRRTTTKPIPTLPRLLFDSVLPDSLVELKDMGLECRPGRTIIIVKEKAPPKEDNSDEETEGDARRNHMASSPSPDESCNICICSAAGKDEFCTKRPAANVNECLFRAQKSKFYTGNNPYDHERALPQMIRRDLIWNVPQDMPNPPNAICPRGQTYYTNDENAMNPKVYNGLSLPPDTWDRLDFCNLTICFFCVCAVDGYEVKCLPRPVWFCDYYRKRKDPNFMKIVYHNLFGQDRAGYFWTLSARMRRSMDDGIFALIDAGGDALCCDHPAGHRRGIHNAVRARIRQLRRKIPKENLLNGKPGGDYEDFVVNNDK